MLNVLCYCKNVRYRDVNDCVTRDSSKSMKFFRHFTVEKKSLLFPAEMRVANKYATCEECLSIKSLFAPKFLVYRGKLKGSETVLRLILSEKKIDSP